jgi:hypothetical protein
MRENKRRDLSSVALFQVQGSEEQSMCPQRKKGEGEMDAVLKSPDIKSS